MPYICQTKQRYINNKTHNTMTQVTKISKSNFSFTIKSYGRYNVTFTSQAGRSYSSDITDMTIIDAVKNTDSPMVKDLNELKRLCKNAN